MKGEAPENEQILSICEFYTEETGWIPVDLASNVRNRNENFKEGKTETFTGGFGKQPGNFIALSIDKPFLELPVYGYRSDVNTTDFTFFFENKKKKSTDWIVA